MPVGLVKFRTFGNLHLYLSKFSGAVQYIFIICTFLSGTYNAWLDYLTMSVFFLSSLETLVLQIITSDVNKRTGSILC
jgi:hypothetical protein